MTELAVGPPFGTRLSEPVSDVESHFPNSAWFAGGYCRLPLDKETRDSEIELNDDPSVVRSSEDASCFELSCAAMLSEEPASTKEESFGLLS